MIRGNKAMRQEEGTQYEKDKTLEKTDKGLLSPWVGRSRAKEG